MLGAIKEIFPAANLAYILFEKWGERASEPNVYVWWTKRNARKEDHRCLDIVLPCVTAFMERCIGMLESRMLTTVHTSYSFLLHNVWMGLGELFWTEAELQVMNIQICNFKKIVEHTFAKPCLGALAFLPWSYTF